MNRFPEQRELVRLLREAYQERCLSLNLIVDMMPEDERKIGRSTCQRLFNRADAENLNYDYNTLILLSEILLKEDEEDDEIRLNYKKKVIEDLSSKITEKDQTLEFRAEIIKKQEETIADLRKQNGLLTELLKRQMERCDNCSFIKKEPRNDD